MRGRGAGRPLSAVVGAALGLLGDVHSCKLQTKYWGYLKEGTRSAEGSKECAADRGDERSMGQRGRWEWWMRAQSDG